MSFGAHHLLALFYKFICNIMFWLQDHSVYFNVIYIYLWYSSMQMFIPYFEKYVHFLPFCRTWSVCKVLECQKLPVYIIDVLSVYKISLELCTLTLDIQLLVLTKVDSVVTSYIISTPSALRKYCFVILRNLMWKKLSF